MLKETYFKTYLILIGNRNSKARKWIKELDSCTAALEAPFSIQHCSRTVPLTAGGNPLINKEWKVWKQPVVPLE